MSSTSIVTVTHNSSHLILDFLGTLLCDDVSQAKRVIVVDSGSADAEATRKLVESVGATYLGHPENVGYGTASNLGAHASTSDWIAFVNPDVKLNISDIDRLVEEAESHRYQCLGPTVLNQDGVLQVSWHSVAAPPWRKNKKVEAHYDPEGVFAAQSVSGCCMVFEREWFEKLSGFDESFFMFCEEIDLHKRLGETGGKVGVSSSVRVVTPGGASSLGITKRWSNVERAAAHVQFTSKHYSKWEGALDAIWRVSLILVSPGFSPRTKSLRQFAARMSSFLRAS